MAHDGSPLPETALLPDLLGLTAAALPEVEALFDRAREALRGMVTVGGKVSAAALEEHQFAAHSLSWLATYVESLRQMRAWAGRLAEAGTFGEMEGLLLQIAFGEYLSQIRGGISMSQGEVARLADLGVDPGTAGDAALRLMAIGNTPAVRARLVALMRDNHGRATFGVSGLDDELEMIREQFRRFADEQVVPHAHGWHLRDELIPMEIIQSLAEMGVFGLTIPEEFGGFGLSKASMVVVSEELSRGYIGVGSLGTRSEIAAELILCGGTPEQKAHWLPKLASGEILPTAVFTEPNTGSDLGSLRTRAVQVGADWEVTGNKTWITHAARTHVMTLLAQTDPDTTDSDDAASAAPTPPSDSIDAPLPTPTPTATEGPDGEPLPPAPVTVSGDRVTAVGDSVMLASAGGLLDELPGVQIDAEVSRSMWAGSKIIDRLSDQGALRDYVVVGLGTNGPVDSDALQNIYDRVGRDRALVLVTAFAPRDWIPGVNAELTAFAASHPGVVIADWSGAIASHADVLAGDGIHPGETGGRIYADTVTHAVDAVANQRAQTRYQVQLIRWATTRALAPVPPS